MNFVTLKLTLLHLCSLPLALPFFLVFKWVHPRRETPLDLHLSTVLKSVIVINLQSIQKHQNDHHFSPNLSTQNSSSYDVLTKSMLCWSSGELLLELESKDSSPFDEFSPLETWKVSLYVSDMSIWRPSISDESSKWWIRVSGPCKDSFEWENWCQLERAIPPL